MYITSKSVICLFLSYLFLLEFCLIFNVSSAPIFLGLIVFDLNPDPYISN